MPKHNTSAIALQLRAATLAPVENDIVFRVVWTTGALVRRYDYERDTLYDEELVVAPENVRMERMNSGTMPVLDSHNAFSIDDVKGVVVANSGTLSGGEGAAMVRLDDGEENAAVVRKVRSGFIRNVSMGYRVHAYEIITREGDVPLYRAMDWEPYEISLVPIGADANAGIRSGPPLYPCQFSNHVNLKETRMQNPTPQEPELIPTPEPAAPPARSLPIPMARRVYRPSAMMG